MEFNPKPPKTKHSLYNFTMSDFNPFADGSPGPSNQPVQPSMYMFCRCYACRKAVGVLALHLNNRPSATTAPTVQQVMRCRPCPVTMQAFSDSWPGDYIPLWTARQLIPAQDDPLSTEAEREKLGIFVRIQVHCPGRTPLQQWQVIRQHFRRRGMDHKNLQGPVGLPVPSLDELRVMQNSTAKINQEDIEMPDAPTTPSPPSLMDGSSSRPTGPVMSVTDTNPPIPQKSRSTFSVSNLAIRTRRIRLRSASPQPAPRETAAERLQREQTHNNRLNQGYARPDGGNISIPRRPEDYGIPSTIYTGGIKPRPRGKGPAAANDGRRLTQGLETEGRRYRQNGGGFNRIRNPQSQHMITRIYTLRCAICDQKVWRETRSKHRYLCAMKCELCHDCWSGWEDQGEDAFSDLNHCPSCGSIISRRAA
ncbi:hypothetical protein BT63DRAFT_85933 [Microthyrium microscopicum]|uniref:Uncharacterized protein n=1 Tax=Microthyrium microscopicum TaxID=703497 RepID=A0A6A6U1I8_9PEZI|nr:hypothetical protein BT63DRAFT_85933 [Microthyrium microscopicum]